MHYFISKRPLRASDERRSARFIVTFLNFEKYRYLFWISISFWNNRHARLVNVAAPRLRKPFEISKTIDIILEMYILFQNDRRVRLMVVAARVWKKLFKFRKKNRIFFLNQYFILKQLSRSSGERRSARVGQENLSKFQELSISF